MLYGLIELFFYALEEFHRLSPDFYKWIGISVGCSVLFGYLFWFSGRLVYIDWKPSLWLGGFAAVALPISLMAFLLLPASIYLKPAVVKVLGIWETDFLQDDSWNSESFRQEYWAVRTLKKPDGSSLEDFTDNPSPEEGGHIIPANAPASKAVIAEIDSRRVAEHFQLHYELIAKLLWTRDRPLPEVLRNNMEQYFRDHPGMVYEHNRAVQLAGTEMQTLLEHKIGRIVLTTRVILVSILGVLWIPLCTWAMYDAWKKLEPITGKQ